MGRRAISPALPVMAAALLGVCSQARSEPQSVPDTASVGLEEITVTAQRRSENQQNVPISVTTITAAALSNSGVEQVDQLAQMTPSLMMNRQLKGLTPYIRGVGTVSVSAGVESPVATYVDGVYYMSAVGNIFSFNNIQQVEVLRGPQGTLFGRNATGGLIDVTTRDPQVQPAFEGSFNYSNYNTPEGSVYVTGGSGNVVADFAGYGIHQNDGFGHYILTGDSANYERDGAYRSKLLWTPTDADRITLSADFLRDTSDMGATGNTFPGTVNALGSTTVGTPYNSPANYQTNVDTRYWGASLRYQHQFAWAQFSSLTAYRDLNSQTNFDLDQTAAPFLVAEVTENNETIQQEFLLVGTAGPLDWTTGIFLFNAISKYTPLAIRSVLIPPENYNDYDDQKTKSYAEFADVSYSFPSATKLIAGIRYTVDERTFTADRIANDGSGPVILSNAAEARYPKVTFRVVLDQKLTENALVYASYNTGYKSGTFNAAAFTQPPVKPESLDAFEVGLKSEFIDRTLRLNMSAFHYSYDDIQLGRLVGGTLELQNAAKGEVYGGEIESLFAPHIPVGAFEATGGLSFLHARYTSFPGGPISLPAPAVCTPVPMQTGPAIGGDVSCTGDLSGKTMVRSPDWTLNIGGDYKIPLGDNELDFTVNVFHSANFFWEPDNRLEQPAYSVVNAQLAYAFGSKQALRLRAFAKNLNNAHYTNYAVSGALGDWGAPAPPRTYGVGVDVKL